MDDYGPATYGDHVADVYDGWYSTHDEASVALLAELARGGAALELGVGTGRVALPLAARGVEVHGLDASAAMLERLRSKPGGAQIRTTLGSFADFDLAEEFSLAYVVFNTFFSLQTQEEQLSCFASVARHLVAGGVFLIEAFVPDLERFEGRMVNRPARVAADRVELDVSEHFAAEQRVAGHKVVLADGQPARLYPVRIRYCWPSELDLMARLAGLSLRGRAGGWRGEPFTDASTHHVSIYERGT